MKSTATTNSPARDTVLLCIAHLVRNKSILCRVDVDSFFSASLQCDLYSRFVLVPTQSCNDNTTLVFFIYGGYMLRDKGDV